MQHRNITHADQATKMGMWRAVANQRIGNPRRVTRIGIEGTSCDARGRGCPRMRPRLRYNNSLTSSIRSSTLIRLVLWTSHGDHHTCATWFPKCSTSFTLAFYHCDGLHSRPMHDAILVQNRDVVTVVRSMEWLCLQQCCRSNQHGCDGDDWPEETVLGSKSIN